MPPSSWKLMAFCLSRSRTNSSANALTTSETSLETLRLLLHRGVRLEPLLVDVPGEGVRRGDRHDRGGHERTDGDGRERDPREPRGEHVLEQLRDDELRVGLAVEADRLRPRRDRDPAEQREEAEHEAVGREDGRVAPDRVAGLRRQARRDRVRVHEQRERRPEAERGVGPVLRGRRDERAGRLAVGRVGVAIFCSAAREDGVPAADLGGQVDDRDDDHEVDQGVLDEGDDRGRAQAARVGVRREQREGDEQRQVLGQDVVAATEPDDLEDGLDADELERDVRHRREEPGDGDGERQPARAEPAPDEVGRRHVAVTVAHGPQATHEHEDDRVEHDRVGHGEEARDRPGREHGGRHRDERVGRVEVAAEQEPRDPGAERAAAEAPLVEGLHRRRTAPARRPEAHARHEGEQGDEDGERDAVDPAHDRSPVPSVSTIERCGRATRTIR